MLLFNVFQYLFSFFLLRYCDDFTTLRKTIGEHYQHVEHGPNQIFNKERTTVRTLLTVGLDLRKGYLLQQLV